MRFWLSDTDDGRQLLSNEEIAYLVTMGTPIWGDIPTSDSAIAIAALAADVIVGKATGILDISADGVSVSGASQLAAQYRQLGDSLRKTYQRVAGAGAQPIAFGINTFEFPDFGTKPLSFGIGFMDNARAGRQDFGDERYEPFVEIPESGYWTP